MQVLAISSDFRAFLVNKELNEDMKIIGLVVVACVSYMIIHTGSVFLSVFSMINIFMSIPIGLFLYKQVFNISYFSTLHMATVFIVLGIGCDDVFVFHDFWKSSFQY